MGLQEITPNGTSEILSYAEETIKFSFFIPCFNEEKNIINVVEKLTIAASTLGLSYEILVFDDCSADRTVEVVQQYQSTHPEIPLRLFANSVNCGVARNFIEGAFLGHGKYYRMVMGDDVESIETFLTVFGEVGKADIVIPYHAGVVGRPVHRKLISRLYTVLVNVASKRHLQYYNGLPVFLRSDAIRFHVEATGLGFQAEFLLRLLQEGRSFVEIPVTASDREGSTSLNLRNFVSVGYSIFKIYMRRLGGKNMQ